MDEERESPKLGSLRKLGSLLPRALALIPSEPVTSSETTGSADPVHSLPSRIGTPHGGTGFAVLQDKEKAPLAAFDLPSPTLRHLLGPLIVWGEQSVTGTDGQFEGTDITGVAVVNGADRSVVQSNLSEIKRICEPGGSAFAAQKLAELRALTVHRAKDGGDAKMMAVAFSQRLAAYPQDVIDKACNGWADREEFWPSWAELKAECDKRMRGRLKIKAALERALA